ncbi:hypothetical protein SAMN06266982_10171 [Propioniciclava tarda]|nr:hypothetical protein SAMN06266982_10171 [Propioniciclava tarda]
MTSQASSACPLMAAITSAPSANCVVRPRCGVNPSVPTKASRTLKSLIARRATGPTSDSLGRWNVPPVMITVIPALWRAWANTSVEFVTIWTPRRRPRCRTIPAVVVPASIMMRSPSRTSSAAAWAITSFSAARDACRVSNVLHRGRDRPAVGSGEQPARSTHTRAIRTQTGRARPDQWPGRACGVHHQASANSAFSASDVHTPLSRCAATDGSFSGMSTRRTRPRSCSAG